MRVVWETFLDTHRGALRPDEFFYVLQGRGTIRIGNENTVIEAGDTVVVLVGEDHRITSSEDDPLTVVYFLDRPGLEEQFRLKLDRETMTLEEFNAIVRSSEPSTSLLTKYGHRNSEG